MPRFLKWLAASLLALTLLGCTPQQKTVFKTTDISGADFGGSFVLTGHDGKRHRLEDFKGKAVALFFGYTHCPDVCPTTMLEFGQVAKILGPDADRLQVLFVTVDPERDTTEVLAGYVPHFDKRFLGLTGSAAEVAAVSRQYKIVAQKQPAAGGSYTVDHSAGTYLFDPEGKLRLYSPYGTSANDIAHDVKALLG